MCVGRLEESRVIINPLGIFPVKSSQARTRKLEWRETIRKKRAGKGVGWKYATKSRKAIKRVATYRKCVTGSDGYKKCETQKQAQRRRVAINIKMNHVKG